MSNDESTGKPEQEISRTSRNNGHRPNPEFCRHYLPQKQHNGYGYTPMDTLTENFTQPLHLITTVKTLALDMETHLYFTIKMALGTTTTTQPMVLLITKALASEPIPLLVLQLVTTTQSIPPFIIQNQSVVTATQSISPFIIQN